VSLKRVRGTIQACGIVAKASHVRKVGGYDNRYFIWVNDIELAANLINHGYHVYHYPNVTISHKSDSWSGGSISEAKSYYHTRNYAWYYWKHYSHLTALTKSFHHFVHACYRSVNEGTFIGFAKGLVASMFRFKQYYFDEHVASNEVESY
jgi:GT2 family glycosyltransferase